YSTSWTLRPPRIPPAPLTISTATCAPWSNWTPMSDLVGPMNPILTAVCPTAGDPAIRAQPTMSVETKRFDTLLLPELFLMDTTLMRLANVSQSIYSISRLILGDQAEWVPLTPR